MPQGKIKPIIRLRPTRSDTCSDLADLLKQCSSNQVIVRGSPANIKSTIKRKLQPVPYRASDYQIIGKVIIDYIFRKLGNCHLSVYCNNACDFYTSVEISKIPISFQFFTSGSSNPPSSYGFDIRSLECFRESGRNFRNPYTDQPFTEQELDYLQKKIKWLTRLGYPMHCQPVITNWTPDQIYQYTINVFSILNEHQYVDYEWFTKLSYNDLKSLYHELHEIWNYRLPMQDTHKANMVKGPIFNKWEAVRNYKSEDKIRLELLQDIERLITEGVNEDYRKNGCYIFVLGLVLISEDAATSHPAMFQAAYRGDE